MGVGARANSKRRVHDVCKEEIYELRYLNILLLRAKYFFVLTAKYTLLLRAEYILLQRDIRIEQNSFFFEQNSSIICRDGDVKKQLRRDVHFRV